MNEYETKEKRFLGVLSMVICLSLLGNIPTYAAVSVNDINTLWL